MRFKPRTHQEQAPQAEAVALPPKVEEALDKATLHARAEGDDHHRVAVQLPGKPAFMYQGEDEAADKLAAMLSLEREQAKEAAKRLDTSIRKMIRTARRERRSAGSWVRNY
jgi:hypothetical protein